jgi:hypothetical protein
MAGEQTEVIGYEEPNAAQFYIKLKGIKPKVGRTWLSSTTFCRRPSAGQIVTSHAR